MAVLRDLATAPSINDSIEWECLVKEIALCIVYKTLWPGSNVYGFHLRHVCPPLANHTLYSQKRNGQTYTLVTSSGNTMELRH